MSFDSRLVCFNPYPFFPSDLKSNVISENPRDKELFLTFSNPNAVYILNKKQPAKFLNIQCAFGNPNDRKIFLKWADKNTGIVHENQHISKIVTKIKALLQKINSGEDNCFINFGGSDKFIWIIPLSQHRVSQLKELVIQKNYEPLATFENIDQIKQSIELAFLEPQLVEIALVPLIELSLNVPLKKPNLDREGYKNFVDTWYQLIRACQFSFQKSQILNQTISSFDLDQQSQDLLSGKLDCFAHVNREVVKKCLDAGFLELSALVETKLHLKSEKYQSMKKSEYDQLIINLKIFIDVFLSDDLEKFKYKEMIFSYESQEQRTLFQYIKKEELNQIDCALKNLELVELVSTLVLSGEWMTLFNMHGKDETLAYVLLAAYRQKNISLNDLATAMIFHRAYFNAPKEFKLHQINFSFLEEIGYTKQQSQEWINLLKTVPENQKYAVIFNFKALDSYTLQVINTSFSKFHIPGIILNSGKIGIFSFGLLDKYFKNQSIELVPLIHLTPRRFMLGINRLAKFKSDFALLLPREKTIIHGSQDSTIFSPMHDLFHATARVRSIKYHPTMMNFVKKLIIKKKELTIAKICVSYRDKLASEIENVNPKFKIIPSREEFFSFFIDQLVGEVIDGTYEIDPYFIDEQSALRKLIHHLVEKTWIKLPGIPDFKKVDILEQVLEVENDIFECLDT